MDILTGGPNGGLAGPKSTLADKSDDLLPFYGFASSCSSIVLTLCRLCNAESSALVGRLGSLLFSWKSTNTLLSLLGRRQVRMVKVLLEHRDLRVLQECCSSMGARGVPSGRLRKWTL